MNCADCGKTVVPKNGHWAEEVEGIGTGKGYSFTCRDTIENGRRHFVVPEVAT